MSNFLAIATVTATLRRMLSATVAGDVPSADATAVRPDQSATGLPSTGVNIYLYQVSPNPALRNADMPTRDSRGNVTQKPRIALDLHYLLTFYGNESDLEPQRVLGSVARTLHAQPYLTRQAIRTTVTDPEFAYLDETDDTPASDLADDIELVKLTPIPLSLEELSKLWSVMLQTTYALSMAYLGTVVLIEGQEHPRRALPVRERIIDVFPFQRATVDRVVALSHPTAPIEMGDTVDLEGSSLAGAIAFVRVGRAKLQPVAGSVTPSGLRVALADPDLRAGVQGVQMVYASGTESNVAALVLRPRIVVDAPVTAEQVPISFDPPVGRQQRVTLHLNEVNAAVGREPRAYTFDAPSQNGIADPLVDETTSVTFEISDVEPHTYLVRVRVDGAENVLEVDTDEASPTFGFYIGPVTVIP